MDRLRAGERRIIEALVAKGGSRVSFFKLTVDAELDYWYGYRSLRQLEAAGLVLVERAGPGRALRMSLARPVLLQMRFELPVSRR